MQKRSPEATDEQILEWFFENRMGIHAYEAYKIAPGRRLAPGVLERLVDEGKLITVWIHEGDKIDDPWNFTYRLSYDEWITRLSRNELRNT